MDSIEAWVQSEILRRRGKLLIEDWDEDDRRIASLRSLNARELTEELNKAYAADNSEDERQRLKAMKRKHWRVLDEW